MEAILDFLSPIYFIALTGSYALLQNLQALGITSIWSGPYIDLPGTINIISGGYFLFLLLLCLVNVISSVALSSRFALALFAAWLSPCILHSFGVYTVEPVVPERFTIGSGGPDQMGLPEGALINSITVVVLSWSIATITLHAFRAGKSFKSFFDHIWYLFGVSAIVFYVSDQSTVGPSNELSQAKSNLYTSLSRLDNELRRLNNGCAGNLKKEYQDLCLWSEESKNYIDRYRNMNDVEVTLTSAPNIDEILSLSRNQNISAVNLKAEIERYNTNNCKTSAYCSSLSVDLNRHPGLLKGDVNPYTKYALSIEAIMPTITREWSKFKEIKNKINGKSTKENKRWVILVFVFSILIGIKVSNSSRELFGGREESIYRKTLFTTIKNIKTNSSKLIDLAGKAFNKALQRTSR
ncbi:hypothetical protein ACJJIK_02170 [Microbulbifer sp. ZKSA006]|uniref:hypothetical protein n=1 Tax=unclassified Microbulbifer TaxID=2619833 RepID=UPI0024ADAE9F|nr:hypothetical protein [Microbulbifer sp. VAAF005]WHI48165.1 hypothetical protein P0078_07270 [Microbulbifer sp. VAAF005]